MKKILMVGTALTMFGVGAAHASSPIRLELGGESTWLFGVATQKNSFKEGRDFSSTDIKGTNLLDVNGSTILDNGMKVGFAAVFRAGGNSNTAAERDPVDQSWVYAEGRLGRLVMGTIDNPAYQLHVTAPDAAGLSEDGDMSLLSGQWVVVPEDLYYLETTAIDWTGSSEKVMYFTPRFAGFTLGVGFTPGSSNNGEEYTQGNRDLGVANETYTVGLNFEHEFDNGLEMGASLGWQTGKGLHLWDDAGHWHNLDTYNDYSGGLIFAYEKVTVGGAVRFQKLKHDIDDKIETLAWTVGAQYDFDEKVIPLVVSLNYFNSRAKFKDSDGGRDKVHNVNLSASYELGEGVDWITTVGYIKWDSNRDDVEKNRGWAGMTGLALTF